MPQTSCDAQSAGTFRLGGGATIRRLGFGAMRVTGPEVFGAPADPREARAVLRRAVELGVDHIDTADAYGPAVSERLIAEALYPYPRGLVIATKGGVVHDGPLRWSHDGRPAYLRAACEASLRRLRLQRIELYYLHAVDARVPFEDSVDTLAALRAEGKIRRVGLSNVTAAQLALAQAIVPVAAVQNRFSLASQAGADVLAACERAGIAFVPYYPLGASDLARGGGVLQRVADRHRATNAQVALAWLLARSPVVCPIPGTSRRAHLEQNVRAAGLALSARDLADLAMRAGAASDPRAG